MSHFRWIIINSERRRQEAIEQLQRLRLEPGHIEEITIRPYEKLRSLRQNNLYHGWATDIGRQLGNPPKAQKLALQAHILGYESIQGFSGPVTNIRGTSDLNTKEFSEFLDGVFSTAAGLGINLWVPQDYGRITRREVTHD